MAIKDKLLFQVELIPPTTGDIRKVSQVLDQATASQQKFNKSQTQSTQNVRETEAQLEKYDQQLRELREGMRRAEEGARFYGKSNEQATQSLREQIEEARRVRTSLDKLEAQVQQSGVSMKKFQRIQSRATSGIKSGNLALDRVGTGFKSMTRSVALSNQAMMDFGRIVQDAPFGMIGISNNLDPMAQSFRRLSTATGSSWVALKKMAGSLMGSGGLIFLLGSALPTASLLATNGMIGFGSSSDDASDSTVEFNDNLKSLMDNLTDLEGIGGDDPLGIQDIESELRSIQRLRSSLSEITELQEEKKTLESQATAFMQQGVNVYEDQEDALQEQIETTADRFGITVEQLEKLQEQEDSLSKQLETLTKMGRITGVQAFELEELDRANTMIDRFNLGINRVGDTRTVESLETQKENLQNLRDSWVDLARQGNTEVLPFLRASGNILDDINDTLDEIPERPSLEIEAPEFETLEDEISDQQLELGVELDFDEVAIDQFTGELLKAEDLEKLNDRRAKFQDQLSDRTFKIRENLSSDIVALQISTQRQLNEVEERAQELGLQHTKEVEHMKTAIRRQEAEKRKQIELSQEEQLQKGRMNIVSHSANFIKSINSALAEESRALALLELSISKGLEIAKVIMTTNQKVSELKAQASEASSRSLIESAKATASFASGNFASGVAHSTASAQFASGAGLATAQAGKVASQGAITAGLIGATTLAEAGGILSGGGDSGSGDSGGSGGGMSPTYGEGFMTDEEEPPTRSTRDDRADSAVAKRGQAKKDGDVYVNVYGDIDDRMISLRAEEGRKKREHNARVLKTDAVGISSGN